MSETKRRFVMNAFKLFDLALLIVAFALASMLSDGPAEPCRLSSFFR